MERVVEVQAGTGVMANALMKCLIIGTSHRVRIFLLAGLALSVVTGCVPGVDGERPTLGGNVTDEDPIIPADDPINPAGDDVIVATLDVQASPVFCCNPLSLNFSAALTDQRLQRGATFEWDFGDRRTGSGPSLQHTYNWAGNYDVFVTVTLADGRQMQEYRFLQLRVDDGVSVVDVSDPGELPVLDGVDPADDEEDSFALSAGDDKAALTGEVISLQGQVSAPSRTTITLAWTQLFGPTVALRNATTLNAMFTAPPAPTGPVTLAFRLTATDGVRILKDEIQVTVLPTDQPSPTRHAPIADDRSMTMIQGETATIRLTGSDVDGDDLTFSIVTPPAHGNVGPIDNNPRSFATFNYTPDADFFGSDSLQYTASDGTTVSNLAMVTITVHPLGEDPDPLPDPTSVRFLAGPPLRATAGRYQVSFEFAPGINPSAVSLRRDCCLCQDTLSGALTPSGSGVYSTNVDVPNAQTVWYHVFFTHGGIQYMSQSKYVNAAPLQPAAPPAPVIWYHQCEFDANLLRGVLATGEITHVMIGGGDRGVPAQDPNTLLAFQICRQNGVKTIWSRHIWNNFGDYQTIADTEDPNFYRQVVSQVRSEQTLLGADFSGLDGEPYTGSPLDHYLDVDLSPSAFAAVGAAIQMAAQTAQVDFMYPTGTHGRPMRVNNLYQPLGRTRIATSTYWDVPHKNCRITYPYDIFSANIQPTTLRPGAGTSPFFLPHDIIQRRYLWSAADGAENNVNGLFLYPGSQPEDNVEVTAILFAELLGGS